MRHKFATLLLVLGIMVSGALPAAADGGPEDPLHIAIGDSQAYGFGVTDPDQHGYVAVLNRWLTSSACGAYPAAACPHLELTNLSVPGATSTTLLADQLQPALQLIHQRKSDGNPGNDVVFITVTIGGNDIFDPVIGNCAGGITPTCVDAITVSFGQYATNLTQILGSLRAAAGPETRIVISTYDNPLASCQLAPLAPLGDLVLEGGPGLDVGFNDLIWAIASGTGAEVADMFGQLDVDDWVGGADCRHPDKSGYHEMAEIFWASLR